MPAPNRTGVPSKPGGNVLVLHALCEAAKERFTPFAGWGSLRINAGYRCELHSSQHPASSSSGELRSPAIQRRYSIEPTMWRSAFPIPTTMPSGNATIRIQWTPLNANGESQSSKQMPETRLMSHPRKLKTGTGMCRRRRIARAIGLYMARKLWRASSATCTTSARAKATQARPKFQSNCECLQGIPTIMYWETNRTGTMHTCEIPGKMRRRNFLIAAIAHPAFRDVSEFPSVAVMVDVSPGALP
jgi:hypothetical protein